MPKLSDLQASLLLEEIACAMRVGTPMDQAMRRLESRRLGAVAHTASAIADGVEQGLTTSSALQRIDPGGQASAAVAACEQTGDPGLIERIAFQLRRRSHVRAESRLAWLYPWVILGVGYLVAALVLAPVVTGSVGFDRTGSDARVWSDWVIRTASWLNSYWHWPFLLGLAAFVSSALVLRRQRAYSRPVRLSLFCSALADQLVYDRPEQEAIRAAAEFSGDKSLQSMNPVDLKSQDLCAVVDAPDEWGSLVNAGDRGGMVAALRYRALLYSESARTRDYIFSRFLPRTLLVVIGSGLVLAYVFFVIVPVYQRVGAW